MKPEKAQEIEMKLNALFGGPGKIVGSLKVRSSAKDVLTVTKEWQSPVFRQLYVASFKTLKEQVSVTIDTPIGRLIVAVTPKEGDDLVDQIRIELEMEGKVAVHAAYRAPEKVRA